MTYLLPEKNPVADQPARGIDTPIADEWSEGIGASTRRFMLETNANNRQGRETRDMEMDILRDAMERGGSEVISNTVTSELPDVTRNLGGNDPAPVSADDAMRVLKSDKNLRSQAFDALMADAQENPERYEGLDLQRETVEETVNQKLKSEYEELLAIEQTVPESRRFISNLTGGFAGTFADVRNAPWMLFGAGTTFLKTMAKGAALNIGAEASQMPSRFEMADRLGIEDPDVVSELALAGIFGGAFEGIAFGVGRGITGGVRAMEYMRTRNTAPRISGDPILDQQVVDAAEEAVTAGENPLEAVQREIERMPKAEPPPPGREPLVLRPEERVMPSDAEFDSQISQLTDEVDRIRSQQSRSGNPLIESLRTSTRKRKDGSRPEDSLQVHPDGAVGQALKAAGITPRSYPGLFSRKGRKDFDNLVASEWEEDFPGMMEATGTRPDADYLDAQGFNDVLIRAANNDYDWLRPRKEVADLEARITELEAAKQNGRFEGPLADFASGQQAEGGLYVNRFTDEWEFLNPEEREAKLDADVRRHIQQNWPDTDITDAEIREITRELEDRGGDADYLIERVLERELEFAELPPSKAREYDDIPWEETDTVSQNAGQGRGRVEKPGQDGGAEGRGGTGQARNVEQTQAGEQALIDGVEPVSATDRALAQRDAEAQRRAGNAAPMDDGLFDLGARDQMDWLDDPASTKADPVMSQQVATIREELEANPDLAGTKVAVQDLDGNVRTVSLSEWSDDLDEFERAIARIDLCGKGPS